MRKVILHIVLALVLTLTGFACVAGQESDPWVSGQEAFTRGDYQAAAEIFEAFLQEHPGSVDAMYNLGNCYLHEGNTGMAVLWYERALKRKPVDADVRHNLAIVNAKRENAVVRIREFFLLRWVRGISDLLPTGVWAAISLLTAWLGLGLIMVSVLRRSWHRRRVAAAICAGIFLLAFVFGAQRYADLHRDDLAVVTSAARMTIAPDTESKLISVLSTGEKVVILDSLQQYYKVRIANFEHGWVPREDLSKI